MKIYFVGSGTGGHFYPLIAVAEALREHIPNEKELRLTFMGPKPFDAGELKRLAIAFSWCPAGKRRKYFSIQNFFDIFVMILGVLVAFVKLLFAYPDVIFSKGGYTSVPVTYAARMLGIPVIIHESDAVMGSANKLMIKAARYIAVSYPHMLEGLPEDKTALIGIPIRKAIRSSGDQNEARERLGVSDTQKPVILILGGSLGAEWINNFVLESLDTLLPLYTIIHQTGRAHIDIVKKAGVLLNEKVAGRGDYIPRAYLDSGDMRDAYTLADLVIARAGSTTIAEIAIHGKPSILIPIPENVSHDQVTNAYTYAKTGAAEVLEQENLHEHIMKTLLDTIIGDSATYIKMHDAALAFARPNAATQVAEALIAVARGHTATKRV